MELPFWQAIVDADYAVPAGYAARDLTVELMSYLGSPDPQLRDDIAYGILARWITRGVLSAADLRPLIAPLTANFRQGTGEARTEAVLLRSFSALILAAIVYADNHQPFLTEGDFRDLLDSTLDYLAAEQDVRGYVADLGWAHSVAHTADLLDELALSRYATPDDLARILEAIGRKVTTTRQLLLFNEDDRLAQAALSALSRESLALEAVQHWAEGLGALPGSLGRSRIFSDPGNQAVYLNTRGFLRSLALRLLDETLSAGTRACGPLILGALRSF